MIFHTQSLILSLKGKLCMIIHTQTTVYPTIQRVYRIRTLYCADIFVIYWAASTQTSSRHYFVGMKFWVLK